ncbi:haloacid dehalogenase-like hydrolase [Vibrio sp. OCN044]|uniref:Haloacid dehalogenase-like hydrolase n=1 Tax=Vibrio tetraodonis subsp. pristinus TaxID=2695891 RepID=A0A6L8LY54_9VIBR|nr:haloacid dehalogenase-like hydrolase [Vibrio tetraodonis]MYM60433.1 haloacid dehalogenase-like hydrolase [Vibrio tetraodonis subsp. pristinus]
MKRLLDCSASNFNNMTKEDLLFAIKASEGRVLMTETIASVQPLLTNITNAELAASQGADLLLINMFDVNRPEIIGLPKSTRPQSVIATLKQLTGRPVGVNLEAVDPEFAQEHNEIWAMRSGRAATPENVNALIDMKCDFIVLTGNPSNGVSNKAITESLQQLKMHQKNKILIIAGKMHGAGVSSENGKKIITKQDVSSFANHGADVILLPAPGTVPGMSESYVSSLIDEAHKHTVLAMTAVGTSQEGADIDTIKRIALMSKMAGADLHHIGDTGYTGIALPENIRSYSIAVRGIRHTYARMARSVLR